MASPAKLNLFLYITGRRANGYHDLQTLFQFLDHGDELTITANNSGNITLSPALADVALEDNLIYKAAMALKNAAQSPLGADIQLHKVLPMGGGIGGGSSNAATTLVALNYLWQTGLAMINWLKLGWHSERMSLSLLVVLRLLLKELAKNYPQ